MFSGKTMKQGTSLIGVAVVMLLLSGSANAADVYLEWDFQNVATVAHDYIVFTSGGGTPCIDISGNGRDGLVHNSALSDVHVDRSENPPTLPKYIAMTQEDSPYGYPIGGNALHFRDDMCIQKVIRTEQSGLPAGAFGTGISVRSVLVMDEAVTEPRKTIYKYCLEADDFPNVDPPYPYQGWVLQDADSTAFELVIEPGSDPCFIAQVWTDSPVNSGVVSVAIVQSVLESQLGYSVIGNPVTWTMTYSVADQRLDLYANGQSVGTASTTGSTAMDTGSGAWVVGNRYFTHQLYDSNPYAPDSKWHYGVCFKSFVDEFKVWDGALTETEVLCDYGEVVGEAACCDQILATGGGDVSDLDQDCRVTLADYAMFAGGWLACTPGYDENCP